MEVEIREDGATIALQDSFAHVLRAAPRECYIRAFDIDPSPLSSDESTRRESMNPHIA